MMNVSVLSQARDYFSALFTQGKLWILIGILPTLVDWGSQYLGISITIPTTYSIGWLFLCLLGAHFLMYRAAFSPSLSVRVKEQSIGLGKWHAMGDPFMIVEPMDVQLLLKVDVFNQKNEPTNVEFQLRSIDTDWAFKPVKIYEQHLVNVIRNTAPDDEKNANPFNLGAKQVETDVEVYFHLPFSRPDEELRKWREESAGRGEGRMRGDMSEFKALGQYSFLKANVEIRAADAPPQTMEIELDMSSIHRTLVDWFYGWIKSHPEEESRTVFMSFYNYLIGRADASALEDQAPWVY